MDTLNLVTIMESTTLEVQLRIIVSKALSYLTKAGKPQQQGDAKKPDNGLEIHLKMLS